ncbi:MAG TPA: hypothetical protein VFK02_22440 [Kofleriaceae bacterium]|nr:hypothetical protein [Kofleriaceae bacterium]
MPRLFLPSVPRPGHSFFGLLVGGALALCTLTQGGVAEAGRARFGGGVHFSGSVRWHGGAGIRFARPAWRPRVWVGGSVWVGGYYYPRPYYYYYYPYPEYVPSYYGSYYPVQPQSSAPGVVAVAAPAPPPMPTFGIGVFAGGSSVQNSTDSRTDTSDLGALARIRLTPGLLIEGEIAKTSFKDDVRVDRRIGGSLIYEFAAENTFAPYILAGGGVQQADVAGDFQTTQDYGEIGVGLRWALSRNLHLALDIRAGRRQTVDSNQPVFLTESATTVAPGPNNGDTEDFTRGRLAAILNF